MKCNTKVSHVSRRKATIGPKNGNQFDRKILTTALGKGIKNLDVEF